MLAYPLFMVIFGRSAWTIIMIGFVAALPPVILKTLEGMSGTRKVLVNVGRSFNLSVSQQFWKIMFPAALPTIFVGIRLGLIFAFVFPPAGVILSFLGLRLVNESPEGIRGREMAIAGIALGSVTTVLFIILYIANKR